MINYYWKINNLNVCPEYMGKQNLVCTIFASFFGTDSTDKENNPNELKQIYTSNINVIEYLILDDNATYTPYEELTEQQVIDWLLAALPQQKIDEMKADIAKSITSQIYENNRPIYVELPLPWSN
jgi:hypothetical protein